MKTAVGKKASGRERRVWTLARAGSLAGLRLTRQVLSELRPGQARVKVQAVGLNFADVFACQGLYSATPRGPFTPGLEFAGIIEEIAPQVDAAPARRGAQRRSSDKIRPLRVGDAVMGVTRFGAYTDHIDVDPRYLQPLPRGWSPAEGAAYLAQALTAWYALRDLGALRPGQLVLVHSAAGGVGLLALDMIRALGGQALATIGHADKGAILRDRAGLEPAAILVRDPRHFGEQLDHALAATGRTHLDLILDSVCGEYFRPGFDRLAPGGRLVLFGAATMMTGKSRPNYFRLAYRYLTRPRLDPVEMISQNRAVLAFNLIWMWERVDIFAEKCAEMRALRPRAPYVGHHFPFEDAISALQFFQSGASTGKVVLDVTPP